MTPLKLLIQSLKEEVVEDTVHNFHEYWYDFVFNYLSDENKDILRKISNVERLEDVDYSELPLKIKKRFTDWSVEKGIIRYAEYEDGTTLPSWYYMSIQSGIKNDWVIHFSDHAKTIEKDGFSYGVSSPHKLCCTFTVSVFDERQRSYNLDKAGYNFGFPLNNTVDVDGRARQAHNKKYYGGAAVITKVPHVIVHHHRDNESQAIFWGKDANIRIAIDINEYGFYYRGKQYKDIRTLMNTIR